MVIKNKNNWINRINGIKLSNIFFLLQKYYIAGGLGSEGDGTEFAIQLRDRHFLVL